MRIDGAGGCMENRIYEVDPQVAWNVVMLSINELGVTVDSMDTENKLIRFHNKEKIMQIALQCLDEDSVQLIMDARKERLQIYNWKVENKEVLAFFEIFEKKLREFRAFVLCPRCQAKVSSLAKFCPECGAPLK